MRTPSWEGLHVSALRALLDYCPGPSLFPKLGVLHIHEARDSFGDHGPDLINCILRMLTPSVSTLGLDIRGILPSLRSTLEAVH